MINYNRPYRLWFDVDGTSTYLDFATKSGAREWAKRANATNARIEDTITKEIVQ